MLKAFVLCDNITDNPSNQGLKDLQGAGLSRVDCAEPFPDFSSNTNWLFSNNITSATKSVLLDKTNLRYQEQVFIGPEYLMKTIQKPSTFLRFCFAPAGLLMLAGLAYRGSDDVSSKKGKPEQVLIQSPNRSYWSVAFSPDGKFLAVGDGKGKVLLWNTVSWKVEKTFVGKPNARVWNVGFSPNSKRLIASAGNAIIWGVATGKRILTLDHPQVCLGAAFSPDGKWIATLPFEGHIIKLWDSKTGKLLRTFASSQNELWGVAFSPNGKQLASAARDKTIHVWNPHTADLLHKLTGPEEFWNVTYSPDGKRLAGSMSRHFSVWDSATGKLMFTIEGHADRIFNLVYSPDGKRLITGSDDKTIKIWDADTGRNLAVLHGHTKRIHKVAIHPDGSKVASVSSDGSVIIWDVSCPH